jgi:hypothetical protein
MGRESQAIGSASTALGLGTVATSPNATAIGAYNLEGDELFVIGNGTDVNNRSNALTLSQDGTLSVSGHVVSGGVDLVSAVDSLTNVIADMQGLIQAMQAQIDALQ